MAGEFVELAGVSSRRRDNRIAAKGLSLNRLPTPLVQLPHEQRELSLRGVAAKGVDWIKLADCYFVLGNKGLLAGLNWLNVTLYWEEGIVNWIKLADCYFVLGNRVL
jgi:hypothetical protein